MIEGIVLAVVIIALVVMAFVLGVGVGKDL